MLGIAAADAVPTKEVGLVGAGIHVGGTVEDLADLDAMGEQFVAGCFDVGNDQVQALGGAGRCGGDVLAEDDGAGGAGWRELDHAEVVSAGEVGVEAPAEGGVELHGAIDIGDGNDDDFELGGNGRGLGDFSGLFGFRH